MEVTYAQMNNVLSSMGFSIRTITLDNKLRVYEHPVGIRLPLAYYPDSKIVLPHHMAIIEATLKEYGLANAKEFMLQLLKIA